MTFLLLGLLLAVTGCVTAKQTELKTHIEYYPGGELKLRYTYYEKNGREVLHGMKEIRQANGNGITEEYKDGVRVQTYGSGINP